MNQTAPKRRNENRTKVLIYPLVSRTFRPNGKQCDFFPFIQQHPTPTPPAPPPEQYQSSSTRAEALQRSTVFRSVYRWQISYEYMCICYVYSSIPSPPEPSPIQPKFSHFPLFTIYTLLFTPYIPLCTHFHPIPIQVIDQYFLFFNII